ncbi:MAG TPA: ice-binding family protein, partial [Candidatus Dormibacteraeota bacterium]|nr:ice-binding family protein [Candidatus Dormibacteraeota bacterium]
RYIFATAAACLILASNSIAALAALQPRLGTASTFAVLGAAGITNAGATTITGDVGTFPTTSETGFGPGANTVTLSPGSVNHAGDAVTQGAKNAELTAYNDLAGQTPCPIFGTNPGSLDGRTLTPGCYKFSSSAILNVGQTLILSGSGVYVFQIGSDLTIGNGTTVSLINNAQACGVYWQVTRDATVGTTASFQGTMVAGRSISLNTGAVWTGRVLAGATLVQGAVTLLANTITLPAANCAGLATVVPTPTPAVAGAPNGGGGPAQGQGFPWILAIVGAMLGGAGVVSIGLSRRSDRRTR